MNNNFLINLRFSLIEVVIYYYIERRTMKKIIAFAGKGGVGKTTSLVLFLKYVLEKIRFKNGIIKPIEVGLDRAVFCLGILIVMDFSLIIKLYLGI
ncbi:hypothetical protein ES705_07238 [subsurface metagenome]